MSTPRWDGRARVLYGLMAWHGPVVGPLVVQRLKVGCYAVCARSDLNSTRPTLAKPGGNFEYSKPEKRAHDTYSPSESILIERASMTVDVNRRRVDSDRVRAFLGGRAVRSLSPRCCGRRLR
jgi:hypothetical protein